MIHLIFLNLNLSGNWKWTSNKTLHIWVHSHPSRRQKRAVQVAWPAINTVRMSSLLEGYGYGKLPAKSSRILISKCKITLPKKKVLKSWKIQKSFRNLLILGSPTWRKKSRLGMTWIEFLRTNYHQFLDSFTLSVSLLYSAQMESTLSHPSDWPAIVLGWLGFRANLRWIAARFRQNAYVSPHRSAQVNDKPLPAQGVNLWSRVLREVPNAL